ncbi:hypothetical protein [Aeromonas jandaei]|uniref:hypothetical protein n=1 Tax=Aeromonas jandaei TaxID=650 RepID=UPI002AA0E145|nr:hypothetical protein [Aeromonas jandaei]
MELIAPSEVVLIELEWASVRAKQERLINLAHAKTPVNSGLSIDDAAKLEAYVSEIKKVTEGVSNPFDVVWPDAPEF